MIAGKLNKEKHVNVHIFVVDMIGVTLYHALGVKTIIIII